MKFGLELFAGSMGWSAAASRELGVPVLSIDIRFGPTHNLNDKKLQSAVLG